MLVCAAIFGPHGPRGVPDPTVIDTVPAPDFYFLSLFALFALLPPWTETVILLVGPPLAIGFLLALPFIAGTGEKSWRRQHRYIGAAGESAVPRLRQLDAVACCPQPPLARHLPMKENQTGRQERPDTAHRQRSWR